MENSFKIKQLWKSGYYRKSLINYMLKGYVINNRRQIIAIIYNIIKNSIYRGSNDIQIFKTIIDVLNVYPAIKKPEMQIDRASERVKTVLNLVGSQKINKYLDYGCGDGIITQQIGKQFNLSQENVFGIDIHTEGNPSIHYINDTCTNLSDKSINLVTAFVSFHHITNLNKVLSEIHRVLCVGDLLIIREHDFSGDELMRTYLNLIHIFVSVRDYGDYNQKLIDEISYKSAIEWEKIISKHGFYLRQVIKYKGNNPQGLFHACFVKK
ncbi:SAM-dependent methyltransferase [Pacmanvirus A23]|uniref:SAM-dependent methyltransferase n=1 Tax=Pacmanvirus A23 TaxID=1932881 RepID=UPI000A094B3B|nr:SAM-dependent methyltransferase [Pacmanvirus A23]SIP86070.1 SAM-dependent methyltransferase [Pacmanvirus A23]